ncbi:DinB family protein [Salipaludibacillus daqingensis]|uniref:DinB family protein n=1 Tax=Salipaludibacillus daqingensis TaxID=3041001 RepID=UPI002475054C|nr:DinB family protein [Salipaludibacillus daqingensis]
MSTYENDRTNRTTDVNELQKILFLAENLKSYDEKTLTIPIAPGKWSVREIVGHLYYWDSYLMESMIPHMAQDAVLPPFPNPAVYNRAAIASLEGRRATRLIEEFINARKLLMEQLATLDDQMTFNIRGSEKSFTTKEIVDMFTKHDNHHQEQIETFLSSK